MASGVAVARCEAPARYPTGALTRCALRAGHEGPCEPGCSECWDENAPGGWSPVDERNPWCPIRNEPCVRERACAPGLRVVVRGETRREPWFVGEFVRQDGDRHVVTRPAAGEVAVEKRRVIARRGQR